MMLDLVGIVLTITAMVVAINAVISSMPMRPPMRLTLATIVGVWIGLQVALATADMFTRTTIGPVPLVGAMVATPLVAAGVAATLSPAFRDGLLAVPTPLLIGLNAFRIIGGMFFLLAAQGRLGGPFPFSTGTGDVIVGLLAIPVALMLVRKATGDIPMAHAWNVFGALDLFVALPLGVMSAPGSPLQIFNLEATSTAITFLPWVLIPTVLVPFFLIVHGVVFAQLRARAAPRPSSGQMARETA